MKHSVSEIELKNGAKGLLVRIPDASVMTFEIGFRAGEFLSKREKWETAHIMEHIVLGANELYPNTKDFQAEIEKNGAYCNASTGIYDITYEVECADFEWARILGLVTTAIAKPLFLESEFNAEFGNVREELSARSNNHFRHLSLALREKYGLIAMTDQERLKQMNNVTVEDVRAHYKSTHTTSNMRFVIAGNIDHKREETIKKILGTIELPSGEGRLVLPDETPKSLEKPLYLDVQGIDNVYFYMDTFMNRWLRNEEQDALSMANIMLTETMFSKIFGTARELGLVYAMHSSYMRWHDGANWWIGAQIRPENIVKLLDIAKKEIMDLRAGKLSPEDILNAKQYALGRHQRSEQTVAGTAGFYSTRYFYDDTIDDHHKIPSRIEAVDKDAIVNVANNIFNDNIKGFGVLGTCGQEFADKAWYQIRSLWE